MHARRLTLPAVAVLAIACVVLGVLSALADGRDTPIAARAAIAQRPATLVVAAKYARAPVAKVPLFVATPTYAARACATTKSPTVAPVPDSLLEAFGVLRREKGADDVLPAEALTALRQRGLEPFDPAAARLLRTTADGGRAWVVPVRNLSDSLIERMLCVSRLMRAKGKLPVPAIVTVPRAAPTVPVPTTPAAPAGAPHPGLAVVALGGAPAGAGGRLEDLVRGREPVAFDPCGGPDHDMSTVSGIVPDGVSAAFLTSPDGTAIRADVTDNAYTFVVPRSKVPEQRYVVWTGGDGTPHVQPLTRLMTFATPSCASRARLRQMPVVSPEAGAACGPFLALPTPVVAYRATPCAIAPPIVRVTPRPPRVPKRHK